MEGHDLCHAQDALGAGQQTFYDNLGRVTDTYGPAPASAFNASRLPISTSVVPHTRTNFDELAPGLGALY